MIVQFDFTAKDKLAKELAEVVANDLTAGIRQNGVGVLAVSGGNTPKAFFAELAKVQTIEWSKVVVTLVDERWVDGKSERSNARLVVQYLLQGPAAKATFVPLYTGGETPDEARIDEANLALAKSVPFPFDAVILGLGNDGHTASFFPGGDALEAALNEAGPAIAINAPGAGEARVTLTLPTLLNTQSLYLHIEGDEKNAVLQRAISGSDVEQMPIRAVLQQTEKTLKIYWCP